MVLFLIPFCHLSNCNFSHNLIQIFLQLVAGLDRVVFLGFSVQWFEILVSVGGMVKSPKLISSPPDDRVFG